MKEKIFKIIGVIFTLTLVVLGVLFYPLFVSTENGETHCRNLLGFETKCR